jgi:catechol 2,3-dioxygenase-like lactoylglutathione lyase family enzyme
MQRSAFFILSALSLLFISEPSWAQGSGIARSVDDMHVKGIQHVAMTVGDIDETIAFYAKAVPVKVVRRLTVPGSAFPAALLTRRHKKVEIALLAFPTGFVQFMDFEPGKSAEPVDRPVIGPGYTHICIQSPSRDPAIARFIAAGLNVISRFGKPDGVDIGGYGVRYAYGRDPNGIMIENESLDAPRRPEAAWITHIGNTVHDRDRMLAFYGGIIGRKAHRTMEQENRPRLDDIANIDGLKIRGGWLNVGNMDIEVWEYVYPRTPPPAADRKLDEIGYSNFALEVADVTLQAKRLKGDKVRLVGSPRPVAGWLVQFAYDPEGNIFSLVERKSAPIAESVLSLR